MTAAPRPVSTSDSTQAWLGARDTASRPVPSGRTRNPGERESVRGGLGSRGHSASLPGSPGERARERTGQSTDQCLGKVLQAVLHGARDRGPGRAARAPRWAGREPARGGERRLPLGPGCLAHAGPPRNQQTTQSGRTLVAGAHGPASPGTGMCQLAPRDGVRGEESAQASNPGTGSLGCRQGVWCVGCGSRPLTGLPWAFAGLTHRKDSGHRVRHGWEFVTLWGSPHCQQTGRHPNMS